jgi:hypothetical protein
MAIELAYAVDGLFVLGGNGEEILLKREGLHGIIACFGQRQAFGTKLAEDVDAGYYLYAMKGVYNAKASSF